MDNIQPNFYINNPNNQSLPPTPKWWQTKKLGFLLVGLIILGEVVWSVYTLATPAKPAQNKPIAQTKTNSETKSASSISLVGPSSAKVDQEFKVDVKIDTQGALADGIDLVVKYDPNLLEVVDSQTPMVINKIFSNYPANTVDSQAGIINVSATSSPGDPSFSGQSVLGSVSFRAKKAGIAAVSLEFTKGSTTDSNVVETTSGNDILEKVNNLDVAITN